MKKLILIPILLLCSGCIISPFSGNTKSSQSEVSKSSSEEHYQAPAFVNGHTVILNNSIKKSEYNKINKETPLNVWQRFCRWLGNLGILGILGLAAGWFFFPNGTTAIIFFIKERFKKAFTQTVKAIDHSGEVKPGSNLAVSLSKIQDSDVKALVDDVQQPGK